VSGGNENNENSDERLHGRCHSLRICSIYPRPPTIPTSLIPGTPHNFTPTVCALTVEAHDRACQLKFPVLHLSSTAPFLLCASFLPRPPFSRRVPRLRSCARSSRATPLGMAIGTWAQHQGLMMRCVCGEDGRVRVGGAGERGAPSCQVAQDPSRSPSPSSPQTILPFPLSPPSTGRLRRAVRQQPGLHVLHTLRWHGRVRQRARGRAARPPQDVHPGHWGVPGSPGGVPARRRGL